MSDNYKLIKPDQRIIDYLKDNLINSNLNEIYNCWEDGFGKNKSKSNEGFKKSDKSCLNIAFSELIPKNKSNIGIDLPVYIKKPNNEKKIIILAQDPLRSSRDFPDQNKIITGTPFALHSKYYREKRTRIYWEIVMRLCDKSYNVYITDVFKIWAKNSKFKTMSFFKTSIFCTLLEQEISIIKPDKVLSMGAIARDALNNIDLKEKYKIIQVPHPRSRKTSWQEHLTSFNDDAKIAFIVQTVK